MMERTALVLSGGGLRGAAHAGVLRVLERVGLLQSIQVVAGTSAGAIVGAMLASGTSVAAIEQAALKLIATPCDELVDFNLSGLRDVACTEDVGKFSGLLRGQAIFDLVDKNLAYIRSFTDYATLPPDLQDKVKDLLLVSVNLDNGLKTVFCDPARYPDYDEGVVCGRLSFAAAARASSSAPLTVIPFRCPPQEGCNCLRAEPDGTMQTQSFVDGAVRDNCPLKLAVDLAGCTRVLAINLGYAGDQLKDVASQGLDAIVSQSLTIMGTQQLDADIDYLRTHVADGDLHLSAYVLNPRLYDMGTFDFNRIPEAIRRGEQAAEWFLQELDRKLHIFRPDGSVDADRMFSEMGVFAYNYPDPERAERRKRLLAARTQPTAPCNVAQEITRLGLLTVAAVVSISLALFTVGGAFAMKLKPNAASLGDVFVFWDGGFILFLVGWIIILLLLRFFLCRARTPKPS